MIPILCHPKDLAWMEAGMRGDVETAARLLRIRRQLDALPQPEGSLFSGVGAFSTVGFAPLEGVNRGPAESEET